MIKWNMIIDVEKCEDCNNCFLSCKDEHVGNSFPGYSVSQPTHGQRWMNIMRKERGQFPLIDVGYRPTPCQHCENAPCMKAAKNDAVYRREDGIVILDPDKARGQKDLVKGCPYGAIFWNEEKNTPQKCTFCAHLIDDGWKQTRCIQACPTGAIQAIKVEDSKMAEMVKSEDLEVLKPELKTSPRVYYKNLHLYSKCFIAGSVAFENEGVQDCAEGAKVVLTKEGKKLGETITDEFGDFKFDRLDENSGKYLVEIEYKGFEKRVLDVELAASTNLQTIEL